MTPEQMAEELAGVERPWKRRADRARAHLDTLKPGLLAGDRLQASEVVAGLMSDPQRMDDCAALYRIDPGAWAAWLTVAASVRGLSQPVSRLDRLVRDRASEQVADTGKPDLRVAGPAEPQEAPECVPDGWAAPSGWRVERSGVWRETDDGAERVATRPVWVVGYLRDVDGHGYSVRLAWEEVERGVTTQVVPAVVCADSRALVALARDGLPVTSASGRHLAVYIDAAIEANRDVLPIERVSSRLGWMPDGGFLLGAEYIGPGDSAVRLAPDPGLEQVAGAYTPRGTWEGWLEEVVRAGEQSPMLWVSIYNAVASLLIEPLDLGDNWAIDRSGETSRGKSTVGRAGFSVLGDPRARPSWKTTPAGIEAMASMLRHLPLSLDDSKKAHRPEDVAAVVYMHSGGSGKLRGAPGGAGRGVGLRVTERWRSSLDSDGEQALTSFTADAGARARVLAMRGDPLPSEAVAVRVGLGCEAHHGHLGRRVIRALCEPGAVERWLSEWSGYYTHWRAQLAPHGPVPARLARVVAALDLARALCESVGLPTAPCEPIRYAADCAYAGGTDADIPAEALRTVYEVAVARPTSFYGRHEVAPNDEARVPATGWLGAWQRGDAWTHLDVQSGVVRDELARGGFDPGVIDRWRERGWLVCHSGCGARAKARIDGSVASVYRFTRRAIESVLGD